MSAYMPVIGLEIHAELLTASKAFCSCDASFGGMPNTRCCPVCTGMPGALPVINQKAVQYAVKAGYALGCHINKLSSFDRKHYFYPDLPKAFQITQLWHPLCIDGAVSIQTADGEKNIRIERIHLEEDAGKMIHDADKTHSLADYNRCGVPLIEIVTKPDLFSEEEVRAFVEKVRLLLQYAGVCDGKMEQGSLRCDVNISLKEPDASVLGTRAEIKNLNSVRNIAAAIRYEIQRQSALLNAGENVMQETRRFDPDTGKTYSMRSKENAPDYRFFPEPDILQLRLTDEMLDEIRTALPELPQERMKRYTQEYQLSDADAITLIHQKEVSDFYDAVLSCYHQPKSVAHFIIGELLCSVNRGTIDMQQLSFTPEAFAELVSLLDEERVTKKDAKWILDEMSRTGKDALQIASEQKMLIVNDLSKAEQIIEQVLAKNEKAVSHYLSGEQKVFGFLMGQCSKELRGVCTPKISREILERLLSVNGSDT